VLGRAAVSTPPILKRIEYKNAKDVVNLALQNLVSARSLNIREQAMNELTAYATLLPAGWSSTSRTVSDRTMAAYVLLGQVVAPSRRSAWVDTLADAVNPVTGKLQSRNHDPVAGEIASLALGLSANPRHQFLGAMLDALGQSTRSGQGPFSDLLDDLYGTKSGKTIIRQPIRVVSMQPLTFSKAGTSVSFQFSPTTSDEVLQVLFPESMGPLQGKVQREGAVRTGNQKWVVKGVPPGKPATVQFGVVKSELGSLRLLESID
jgi:hypothetical protein